VAGDRARQPRETAAFDVDRVLGAVAGILDLSPERAATSPAMAELGLLVRSMAENGRTRDGPVRETLARIGDRWSTLLVFILRAGPFRHAVLRRLVNATAAEDDISQRMLTLRLRVLERDGIVSRRVTPTVPPQVEYALTPLGRDFAERVDAVVGWAAANGDAIRKAQAAFDEKSQGQV
jgi:DNA-binding HxlR family transcriptional regulator